MFDHMNLFISICENTLKNNLSTIDLSTMICTDAEIEYLAKLITTQRSIFQIAFNDKQVLKMSTTIQSQLKANLFDYNVFPSEYIYCLMNFHIINSKNLNKLHRTLLKHNWKYFDLITTEKKIIEVIILKNDLKNQLVYIYAFKSDYYFNICDLVKQETNEMRNIFNFKDSQLIEDLLKIVNHAVNKSSEYQISFTGYSFSALFAELSVYLYHSYFNKTNARAVTFESPGALGLIEQFGLKYQKYGTNLDQLDVITYLLEPNLLNTTGQHIGKQYVVYSQVQDGRYVLKYLHSYFLNQVVFNNNLERIMKYKYEPNYNKYLFYLNGISGIVNDFALEAILSQFDSDSLTILNLRKVIFWPQNYQSFSMMRSNDNCFRLMIDSVNSHLVNFKMNNILNNKEDPFFEYVLNESFEETLLLDDSIDKCLFDLYQLSDLLNTNQLAIIKTLIDSYSIIQLNDAFIIKSNDKNISIQRIKSIINRILPALRGLKSIQRIEIQSILNNFKQKQLNETYYKSLFDKNNNQNRNLISNVKPFVDTEFPTVNESLFSDPNKRPFGHPNIDWLRPADIKTKNLTSDRNWYVYNTLRIADFEQGLLNDCWIICAFAVLVEKPDLLKQIILSGKECNMEDKYQIRLFHDGEEKIITLDDYLPCDEVSSELVYAKSGKQLWAPLIEKAFAKLYKSYQNLNHGYQIEGFETLFGKPCVNKIFSNNHQENLDFLAKFKECLNSKYKAATICGNKDYIPNDSETSTLFKQMGLTSSHVYCLLSLVNLKETNLVQLRNPLSNKEVWCGDWSEFSEKWTLENRRKLKNQINKTVIRNESNSKSIFWMSYEDYTKYFSMISFCKIVSLFEQRETSVFPNINDKTITVYKLIIESKLCLDLKVYSKTAKSRIEESKIGIYILVYKLDEFERDIKIRNKFNGKSVKSLGISLRELEQGVYFLFIYSKEIWLDEKHEFKEKNYNLVIYSENEFLLENLIETSKNSFFLSELNKINR